MKMRNGEQHKKSPTEIRASSCDMALGGSLTQKYKGSNEALKKQAEEHRLTMKERFAIQEQEKWLKRSQRPETTVTDATNKVKEAGALNQFL